MEPEAPGGLSASDLAELKQLLLMQGLPAEHLPMAIQQVLRQLRSMPEQLCEAREPLLASFDEAGVAAKILSGEFKHIVVMTGAGVSVSAGIPDFRTPGTGLYDNLKAYNLPAAESIFDISYFKTTPAPFYHLAKDLYPGNYAPTPAHYFIRLLHEKGLLLRCFTQNIDSLECIAGLPPDKVMAAHGNFDSAHCISTGQEVPPAEVASAIMAGPEGWQAMRDTYGGLVKPDIVFFGEKLPARFERLSQADMPQCDLLIVMGTSLKVQPFASLLGMVGDDVPRLLINREKVGEAAQGGLARLFGRGGDSKGFRFGAKNYRDALSLGDCDAGCRVLAQCCGWGEELNMMMVAEYTALIERAGPINVPIALNQRAICHVELGRLQQASADLEQALSLQPGFEQASANLRKLRAGDTLGLASADGDAAALTAELGASADESGDAATLTAELETVHITEGAAEPEPEPAAARVDVEAVPVAAGTVPTVPSMEAGAATGVGVHGTLAHITGMWKGQASWTMPGDGAGGEGDENTNQEHARALSWSLCLHRTLSAGAGAPVAPAFGSSQGPSGQLNSLRGIREPEDAANIVRVAEVLEDTDEEVHYCGMLQHAGPGAPLSIRGTWKKVGGAGGEHIGIVTSNGTFEVALCASRPQTPGADATAGLWVGDAVPAPTVVDAGVTTNPIRWVVAFTPQESTTIYGDEGAGADGILFGGGYYDDSADHADTSMLWFVVYGWYKRAADGSCRVKMSKRYEKKASVRVDYDGVMAADERSIRGTWQNCSYSDSNGQFLCTLDDPLTSPAPAC